MLNSKFLDMKELQDQVNGASQKITPLIEANMKALEAWSGALRSRMEESGQNLFEQFEKVSELKTKSPEEVMSWAFRLQTQAFSDVLAGAWINYEHGKKFADLQKANVTSLTTAATAAAKKAVK